MARNPKQDANLLRGNPDTQFKTGRKASELGKKGGIASGEAKRARKTLREELETLLAEPAKNKEGEVIGTVQGAISTALIKAALSGSVKAYEVIRDTMGEKPVDRVMVSEVDPSIVDEVEKMVTGNDKG